VSEVNQNEFDKMFDQAFDAAASTHTAIPDPTPSWEKVERLLQRRRRRIQRLKVVPYVAASFVLGAMIFGSPPVTNAFNPFFQSIKTIQSDVVSLIFGVKPIETTKPKTSPPQTVAGPAGADLSSEVKTSKKLDNWEEAAPLLAFPHVKFDHVPDGFVLTESRLLFKAAQTQSTEAVLLYVDGAGKRFRVMLRLLESNETMTSVAGKDTHTVEEVEVNGSKAFLVATDTRKSSLEYLYRNLYISISGDLTKDEILEIARKMK